VSGWKAGMFDGDLEVAAAHCEWRARIFRRVWRPAEADAYSEASRRFQAELIERDHAREEMAREDELERAYKEECNS
jgi:hypothetical protein